MIKKIGLTILIIVGLLILFIFWMSPSFVGLIPGGKKTHSKDIIKIEFQKEKQLAIQIPYFDKSNSDNLIELRKTFKLDTLVSKTTSDIEKISNIQSWVHSRWKHNGDHIPENFDPIYILKEAEKGEKFRCVEYSLVTTASLQSLSFIVRSVGLMTRDVDAVNKGAGHVVTEIYLKDLKKWFFLDPQYDVMVFKNGIPLNLVEFQHAIIDHEKIEIVNPSKEISDKDYIDWISPYLFYFTVSLKKGKISIWDRIIGSKKQLTLVPKGINPPKYFQRLFRIRTSLYTNSIADFYPKVK